MKLLVCVVLIAVVLLGVQPIDGRVSRRRLAAERQWVNTRDQDTEPPISMPVQASMIVVMKKAYPHLTSVDIINVLKSTTSSLTPHELESADIPDLVIAKFNQRMGMGLTGIEDRPLFEALTDFFDGPLLLQMIDKLSKKYKMPNKVVQEAILTVFSKATIDDLTDPQAVDKLMTKVDQVVMSTQ